MAICFYHPPLPTAHTILNSFVVNAQVCFALTNHMSKNTTLHSRVFSTIRVVR